MVSSSSDTPSFTLLTHAALSHQARLSDISCGCSRLQSNCIFYCFKGKNLFYFLLTHFQVRPPLLCCCQKEAISSQGQCSWGLPRWWPYAEAVKLQEDFVRDMIPLSCWCVWAQVPDLLLRIQGAQAHFFCLSPDSSC